MDGNMKNGYCTTREEARKGKIGEGKEIVEFIILDYQKLGFKLAIRHFLSRTSIYIRPRKHYLHCYSGLGALL